MPSLAYVIVEGLVDLGIFHSLFVRATQNL